MTLFAGAFSLQGHSISQSIKASLKSNLRSVKDDRGSWNEYSNDLVYIVKWDSGAFSESSWIHSGDVVCAVAGDPLLILDECRVSRTIQLEHIALKPGRVRDDLLAACRGTFAFLRFGVIDGTLQLATDRVGLRSIYYVVQDHVLFFSTALRVFEAVCEIKKSVSKTGIIETGVFTFPLADRTPYEGIKVLRECEVLTATSGAVTFHKYYDWASRVEPGGALKATAKRLHCIFEEAVRLRCDRDKHVYSFLSGGMDSRSIVSTLIKDGRDVEALNFSPDGTQDQQFSRLFANEAGERCHLNVLPSGIFPNFSLLAFAVKAQIESRAPSKVDRPQMIWSGDGGSVGLGHVYMDEAVVSLFENGDSEKGVDYLLWLNKQGLPLRYLTATVQISSSKLIAENVRSEIELYPREDIGRQIYLFLLFNDQRRHLFKHFESIDQHGLELLTPFYDATFLEAIAATPIRDGILHRLYADFFEYLPDFARKTPWQTYPGHIPCPIPADASLRYQWEKTSKQNDSNPLDRVRQGFRMMVAVRRASYLNIFLEWKVYIAIFAHVIGAKDFDYLDKLLSTFKFHIDKSNSSNI